MLLGQTAGYLPWFVEADPAFKPVPLGGTPVPALRVTLATGGGERPGTRNPLYLWAGGRKYLLTSETDPLADEPEAQQFQIAPADLATSPLPREKLDLVGVGVIGNDQRFSAVPDRARLQRVTLETAGKTIYDSELRPADRQTLGAVWLVPPAHRDDRGSVVENPATATDWYLWKAGRTAATATTNKVGYYEVNTLPAGDFSYRLRANGYQEENVGRGFSMPASDRAYALDFVLTRGTTTAPATGELAGRVWQQGPRGRQPLAGADRRHCTGGQGDARLHFLQGRRHRRAADWRGLRDGRGAAHRGGGRSAAGALRQRSLGDAVEAAYRAQIDALNANKRALAQEYELLRRQMNAPLDPRALSSPEADKLNQQKSSFGNYHAFPLEKYRRELLGSIPR